MSKKRSYIVFSETFIFIAIWLLFYISPIIANNNQNGTDWEPIISNWIRFLPFVIASFLNHFILVPFLFYKKKLFFFVSAIVLIGGLTFVTELMHKDSFESRRPDFEHEMIGDNMHRRPFPPPQFNMQQSELRDKENLKLKKPNKRPGEIPPLLSTVLIAILIIGFDMGLRTSFKWSKTERERDVLEKEKVKSELAFLRNQLSPHFFMNTLNNIHSLIEIDTEEAKESVIRLSRLMRHLLYESDEEVIPLVKEVSFIQSYVELMKLRFTDKVKVTFTVDSDVSKVSIPPMLFTSLIENAFKYGVSYKQESFVHMVLSVVENELQFVIRNSIAEKQNMEENQGGIGLENTKKRLDLLYASSYELKIEETPKTFSVLLKLPI